MPVRGKLILITLIYSLVLGCADRKDESSATLAIVNVAVVDVASGVLHLNKTIILRDERILTIEPAEKSKARTGLTLIDGAGKFAIPGLWDMHVC